MPFQELASYKRFEQYLTKSWPTFYVNRKDHLKQQGRFGDAKERVTEDIVKDLFVAIGWNRGDINNQVDFADIVLTRLGIKYCIIETKRPGSLAWNQIAVHSALEQARRYADKQHVKCIGVSDGVMFYAADIWEGGLHDRVFISLESESPPLDLWWMSEHGIYRSRPSPDGKPLELLKPTLPAVGLLASGVESGLLHPKYNLPAHCFAYVGDANRTSTWKLPYRLKDGNIDVKRLPKAIQAVLSNYRGTTVSSIPERAIPDVLRRLADASEQLGKMPHQGETADIYEKLAQALEQIDEADEACG